VNTNTARDGEGVSVDGLESPVRTTAKAAQILILFQIVSGTARSTAMIHRQYHG